MMLTVYAERVTVLLGVGALVVAVIILILSARKPGPCSAGLYDPSDDLPGDNGQQPTDATEVDEESADAGDSNGVQPS